MKMWTGAAMADVTCDWVTGEYVAALVGNDPDRIGVVMALAHVALGSGEAGRCEIEALRTVRDTLRLTGVRLAEMNALIDGLPS